MQQEVIIGLARPGDATAISNVVYRCLNGAMTSGCAPGHIAAWTEQWTPQGVVAQLRERIMFVALAAGSHEIIGTVAFEGGEVRNLCVRRDRQHGGIGARLLGTVEALAREYPLQEI